MSAESATAVRREVEPDRREVGPNGREVGSDRREVEPDRRGPEDGRERERDPREPSPARREPNPEALALLERFGAQMRATARRYSASPHDAEDAYQRATEILLTHRPSGSDDELCRWLRSTTKHEALAIHRHRARVVPTGESESVPEPAGGAPDAHDHAERFERLRMGAQALKRLKPQEVRCLLLKAEGFSYQEICETTGFSYTKVNRCLTEGRRAFLQRVSGIESGEECERLAPHLSALADGEADADDLAALRPHLTTCLICRSRLREFRAVPARVAALAPGAALAADGGGSVRSMLESLLGAAQHKAAAFGERAHGAVELATGQKVAAVAASAAAIAGGGATVDQLNQPESRARTPAAVVKKEKVAQPVAPPAAAPKPAAAPPASTVKPPVAPAAPPPAPPKPAPSPAAEFAPAAAPAAVPAPAPAPVTSAPRAPPPAGGGGSGEFGP
jgi:RNA polymerase sigma factor (sigma-70 family)